MAKSLLNLYLQRVSGGDDSYVTRLLVQLAERLVYVPITEDSQTESSKITVNVVRIKEAHRSVVPVFTVEELLREWCEENGYSGKSISVFGADLGAALHAESWVCVNPNAKTPVELQPFMIEELKQIGQDQLPEDEPIAVSDSSTSNIVKESEDSSVVAQDSDSSESEEEQETAQVSKKKSFLEFLKLS